MLEAWPKPEHTRDYRNQAANMKPLGASIDVRIFSEHFGSRYESGKVLSLGDEAPVTAWCSTPWNREAQALGRAQIFADYRLRIAEVSRGYGTCGRQRAPVDSRAAHDQSE